MRLSRICEAILALVAVETAWLAAVARPGARAGLVANGCAGGALLLALRSVARGGGERAALFWLAASLPAHLAELRARGAA